jgi:hypothetical protein
MAWQAERGGLCPSLFSLLIAWIETQQEPFIELLMCWIGKRVPISCQQTTTLVVRDPEGAIINPRHNDIFGIF